MTNTVDIFSLAPYPILIPIHNEKGVRAQKPARILPGLNKICAETWARVAKDDRIVKRIDNGFLKEGKGNLGDVEALREPASRRHITQLCSKSKKIQDNQVFEQ